MNDDVDSIKPLAGPTDHLERLARQLVANHLQVDLRDQEWQQIVNGGREPERYRRVIAIVGAGASADAGLPLAKAAISELMHDLHVAPRKFKDAMERIEAHYGDRPPEFEAALVAFSMIAYPPETVRECVQRLYDIKYRPLLRYEILAHLLKHRFLEAIINFNFDELLDQAIADELTPQEYRYILHDGDCPPGTNDPERPYDLPLYIKPHGTVSHPSSLRFTHEAYFGIPKEIRRVLTRLMSGVPVTLVMIGFSMKSPEINTLLRATKKMPVDVFIVNTEELHFTDDGMPNLVRSYFLPVIEEPGALDDTLRMLWNRVSDQFAEAFKPRGIERHELVCKVFSNPGITTPKEADDSQRAFVQKYLLDRVTLELAMSAAKAKGLVNMSVLADDRCGRYYDLYCQATPENHKPLFSILRDLHLEEIGYSREAFRLQFPDRRADDKPAPVEEWDFWIIGPNDFPTVASHLFELVARQFSANSAQSLANNRQLFIHTLEYLYGSEEVELRGVADTLHRMVFDHTRAIRTYTGLTYETHNMLKRRDWNILFASAETGQWLMSDAVYDCLVGRDVKIYLIVADGSYTVDLNKKYGEKMIRGIRRLPWWNHNRHMTLLTNGQRPLTALYFARRLRSPFISPVVLLNGDDAAVIFESFKAYWFKSCSLGEQPWVGRENLEHDAFFKELEENS